MRILCLHGYGMNVDVMKRQMAALMKFCDPSWDFIFLEATLDCPPAPGARAVSAGPFFCWSRDFRPRSMESAYAAVDEVFKQHGPFDGTFCFSLGVTVMVGYLLQQVTLHPVTPLPVRFGIFCSAAPVLSVDPEYCHSIFGSLSPEDLQCLRSTEDDRLAQITEPARTAVRALLRVTDILEPIIRLTRKDLLHRPPLEIPCPLNPTLFKARLSIPTLHVRAKNDAIGLRETSDLALSFCESKWRQTYEHSAVHNLPRSPAEAQEMAAAMKWVISKSQMSKL
ncbi:hypothetical protein N7494_005017 [Penicillium frequentans]|uniref:Serine hydrolase domain-containing protein n=1 Tax=Penicillium frequentans TaxID=3151616 RepID=A0AAD6D247_9EURO|nr:hypothetical protein N7494_005017 [Penicillium glabrum]